MSSTLEYWLYLIISPLLGGILAAAGLIVAKQPSAKELIGKLVPYQAFVGVGMLAIFVLMLLEGMLGGSLDLMDYSMWMGLSFFATLWITLLVGFLLGFGLIAQWIPGEGKAETKALEIQQKLIGVQVPLGVIAIVCALSNLIIKFKYF